MSIFNEAGESLACLIAGYDFFDNPSTNLQQKEYITRFQFADWPFIQFYTFWSYQTVGNNFIRSWEDLRILMYN